MYYALHLCFALRDIACCHKDNNISGSINEIADDDNKFAAAILDIYASDNDVMYLPILSLDILSGFSHNTMLLAFSPVPSAFIKT